MMPALTTQQQLTILYNAFLSSESLGGSAIHQLSAPTVNGSGLTIGVNQIDFHQNRALATDFFNQVNAFVSANPNLQLTPLSKESDLPNMWGALGTSQVNGQTV